MQEVLNSIDAYNTASAAYQTFGHLEPKPKEIHKGWLLFTYTGWGELTPIDYDFGSQGDSPGTYHAINEYIDRMSQKGSLERGKVYLTTGHLRRFLNGNIRFTGKLKEKTFKELA